ncbi:MAG TPA: ABC transporter substrate-binding protein [Coleofasciculaceae cyanobacterium]
MSLKSAMVATVVIATTMACHSSQPTSQGVSQRPSTSSESTSNKFVAVTQIVEHPALNATRDGVKAELEAAGYKVDKNLKWEWQSAQGQPATATQIASQFVGKKPDVMVAISTPSAQAVVSATRDIPVVFTAVTDPLGAKLVPNMNKPGGLVTGVQAIAPIGKHLDLISKIIPKAKRIGVLYNAGEPNAVTLVNLLKREAPVRGINLVEATVVSSGEVATAARSLVGKADVIYVPTDNTVVSALESVIQVGRENKLPVFSGDNDSVARGAIASLSYNYFDVGRQTGQVVVRILNKEKPGDIAVEPAKKLELHVNPKSAEAMGVKIPESVLKDAAKVIGN